MSQSSRRGNFRTIARWVVALVLLAAIAVAEPLRGVVPSLRSATPGWVALAAAIFLAGHAAHTARLWYLLRAIRLHWSWREIAHFHFTSMAYALALPGGAVTGTAVRLYRISDGGRELGASGAALLVDRLAATLTLGLSGLACAAIGSFPADRVVLAGFIAVFAGGSALMAIAISGAPLLPRVAAWLERKGLSRGAPIKPALTASVVSVFIHAIGIAAFVAAARAVGIPLGYFELGYARAAMIVAAMLPISVAGLGLREGAALIVLGALGVPPDRAVAFSLLVFILGWLLPALFGGALEIFALLRRRR